MKNVVITGAGGQLGKAFVGHLLKDKQYKVYALDLNFTNLNVSTNSVEYVNVDITNEQEVVSFYKTLNSIDVLINNAGIGAFTPFEDRTVEDFMNVVDVNMKGTFLMCREAIKLMKPVKKGKIVNIGSIYGMVSSDPRIYGDSGRNNSEVYSMTKAGVLMLTKYLAVHYAPFNIQINAISPGGVIRKQSPDFLNNYNYRTPVGHLAKEVDLLPALDFLISAKNSYTIGQNITVDGGFTAW
jgi:NAD(P)-dependent dehydrogenase (short-subunit alcohol dehydrogenase family)